MVKNIETYGDWQLYKIIQPVTLAQVEDGGPVVYVGKINFKDRSALEFSYSRFQEEWMYSTTTLPYLIVSKPGISLAEAVTVPDCKGLIISSDISPTDLNKVIDFSLLHPVVVIDSASPEIQKLKQLDTSHHVFILTIGKYGNEYARSRWPIQAAFRYISRHVDTKVLNKPTVQTITITNKKINVTLSGTSSVPVPVFIKESYFPAWQRADRSPIYMATPAFMLTYATSSFEIDFVTTWPVYLGYVIMGLSIAIIFVLMVSMWKRQECRR